MNDLGSLATGIVTYSFPDDTGRFPIPYVSGWLEAHIGDLNAITHECFYVNETGGIAPTGLVPEEEAIFRSLYEIDFYQRSARESLRGIVWGNASADAVTLVKEGDTTIQKVSKSQVSRTFAQFAEEAQDRLDNMVYQYNSTKSAPTSIQGDDGIPFSDGVDYYDGTNRYNRGR